MNKNKIIEIFNEIKENKKEAIAILVILVLVITGTAAAIVNNVNKPRKVEYLRRSINAEDRKSIEDAIETPENTGNDSVAAPNEKPSKSTETKPEKSIKKNETKSNTSTPSSTAKAKTKVWVVDRAAWTETVTKYRTETQEYTVYRFANGREFDNYDAACQYYANTPGAGGSDSYIKTRTVTVPYYEYINHPEQGHWEYR